MPRSPIRPWLPDSNKIASEIPGRFSVGSVHKLIRKGVLPATQLMPSAPWQIPVSALDTEAAKTGVREIVDRRPKFYQRFQADKTLWLPGL